MLDARLLVKKYGLQAKKSWGQNFLVDERAYSAIVEATRATTDDWVIEIGSGLGTLTARLAQVAGHVVAVERERDMIAVLKAELGNEEKIELQEANALTFDYAAVADRAGRPPIVVGNLPYQIASPILFRLLESRAKLARIVVMLQKEMANRIVAAPSTSAYGAMSVMIQMYGQTKLMHRVKAGCFLPAPKVDSAVLRIEPIAGSRAPTGDAKRFHDVVHAAFQQRRKMLRNALTAIATSEQVDAALTSVGIDGQRRGETLSVEEFAALSEALHA